MIVVKPKPLEPSYDAFAELREWPEFRAFATRLGVDLTHFTQRLIITLESGSFPIIEHVYGGYDTTSKDNDNDGVKK